VMRIKQIPRRFDDALRICGCLPSFMGAPYVF
jgi:hypothetical protein